MKAIKVMIQNVMSVIDIYKKSFFQQIAKLQTCYKELLLRAASGTGLEPETDSLYSYIHNAFGELSTLLQIILYLTEGEKLR